MQVWVEQGFDGYTALEQHRSDEFWKSIHIGPVEIPTTAIAILLTMRAFQAKLNDVSAHAAMLLNFGQSPMRHNLVKIRDTWQTRLWIFGHHVFLRPQSIQMP